MSTVVDRQILLALRERGDLNDPLGPAWLEQAVVDFTSLGGHTVLTVLVVLVTGFLFIHQRRIAAGVVLFGAIGAALLSATLKELIGRARPDLVEHLVGVSTLSFPSGHALLSAAIYLMLGAMLAREFPSVAHRRYFIGVAVGLTFLIGLSRVYLGVHWPTDVLAGWSIGASWAWGCLRATRAITSRAVAGTG